MVLQFFAGKRVEGGERLIEQQYRAGEGPARGRWRRAGLPAGQFARPASGIPGEPDLFSASLTPLRRREESESEADIVGDRQPGQEARLLEHDADGWMRLVDRRAVDSDRAVGRRVETGEEAQQRALATARTADHRDDLAAHRR